MVLELGGFAGPEGPSLLTCLCAWVPLAYAPSQVAQAAFRSWRWQANYQLQEEPQGCVGNCLKSVPRTVAWNSPPPLPPFLGEWDARAGPGQAA